MYVLVINSGSSSLKYSLFNMTDETILISGLIDRIGLREGTHSFSFHPNRSETTRKLEISGHGAALDEVFGVLTNIGPLKSLDEIRAVAHRVGHGGKYKEAVLIDDDVVEEVRRMTPMIPLHHPAMIEEIKECRIRMPNAIHVAVFDTSFHRTLPDKATIYGLPYKYFEKGYRRTGFHGHSHAYVSAKAAEYLGKPIEELKIISCHLGNGAGVTAVDGGRSVDTTLGMTAVEGLIMGTRSGDVDPGLMPIIMKEESLSPDDVIDMLYRKSGLAGISGVSRDMREVETAAARGNLQSILALDAFCYKVKRFIGSMLMIMGGCDALVFTGGIGRNSAAVRTKALENTENLGFIIDEDKNNDPEPGAPVHDISHAYSKIKILTVQTFEELMMARECKAVVDRLSD